MKQRKPAKQFVKEVFREVDQVKYPRFRLRSHKGRHALRRGSDSAAVRQAFRRRAAEG